MSYNDGVESWTISHLARVTNSDVITADTVKLLSETLKTHHTLTQKHVGAGILIIHTHLFSLYFVSAVKIVCINIV